MRQASSRLPEGRHTSPDWFDFRGQGHRCGARGPCSDSSDQEISDMRHHFSVVTESQNGDSGSSPSGFSVYVSNILDNHSPLPSEEEILEQCVPLVDMKDPQGTNGLDLGANGRQGCTAMLLRDSRELFGIYKLMYMLSTKLETVLVRKQILTF